jgi:hypothetical protein
LCKYFYVIYVLVLNTFITGPLEESVGYDIQETERIGEDESTKHSQSWRSGAGAAGFRRAGRWFDN